MEEWADIPDFPGYIVSSHGRFMNDLYKRELKLSQNQYGDLSVGLSLNRQQHRLMAKRIVASVFVEGWSERDSTPMLLDGDAYNLDATNIVWRPRWFATTYIRQIRNPKPWYNSGPIIDRFGNEYRTCLEAAKVLGALPRDVVMSALNGTRVPPGGEVFVYIK